MPSQFPFQSDMRLIKRVAYAKPFDQGVLEMSIARKGDLMSHDTLIRMA
jgi:hypothetical protein